MVCSARLPLARLTRFLAGKRAGQARAPPGREVHQYPKLKNSSCLQPKMPPCDFVPEKYDSYSYEQMLKIRQENVSPSLYTFYKKPLLIHQGHMQWLFDFEGQRYLDFFAGIATVSVGHCHPKVTAAAQKQFGRLGHTSNIYLHPGIQEYTEKLTSLLPGSLKVAYLTNSGTEANDLAVLIARVFTRNTDVIGLRGGYHGGSTYAMGITAIGRYKFGVGNGANCHSTMLPDVFRGPWGGSHCRDSPVQTIRKCSCSSGTCHAKDQYIEQFKDTLQTCVSKKVAAFIAEPIQAQRAIMSSYMMNVMCSMAEPSTAATTYLPWVSLHQGINGTVQFPKGFLKEAYQLVRERGGLCIADEVQTGFGRIGSHFWGFQSHDVIPDIVTMAKGIGNGFPMAAVVTTPEIAHSMTENLHFNTFGGNPVACAVGSAVLDAIEEDGLQKNCQEIGTHLLLEFAKLRDMFESVGDVRGKGLMIGIEMVKDKETREPLPAEEMDQIWEDCKDMGLLIGKGGTYLQTFRIKPPMCITKEDADFAVAVFQEALIRHMKRTAEK